MKQERKNKKSAFTLVELIVVMAIIGILTAIAVPRFTSFIQTARDTAIAGEADSIYSALLVAETELLAEGTLVTSTNIINGTANTLPTSIKLSPVVAGAYEDATGSEKDDTWGVCYDSNANIYLTNIAPDGTYVFQNGEEIDSDDYEQSASTK